MCVRASSDHQHERAPNNKTKNNNITSEREKERETIGRRNYTPVIPSFFEPDR